ncbi:MAG: hypothetical protein K2R98_01810 [Gemmataceae bacterium]|nr:hypothetical protein [Gemmataceae bacterium]
MRPDPDRSSELEVFAPADAWVVRRHGPRGYVADEHYQPWLRDEFTYRCLYCACREVWFPDGDSSFSVEHLRPISLAPEGLTDYHSLVYACCQCNASRGAARLPFDPTAGMRQHIEVLADGIIRGLTPAGEDFIRICRLDRPNLVAFRRLMLDVLRLLGRKRDREAAELRRRYLGYPANLPDLSALKPPGGNSRPEGIEWSAFARRERGELSEVY